MVELEAIQSVVTQVAIQAAIAAVMTMREEPQGPSQLQTQPAWEKQRDKDIVDQL